MIVYCLGMMSSGSTWIYNVAREIMLTTGKSFAAYRVETPDELLDSRAAGMTDALLRGHNIDTALLRLLRLTDSKVILSFRDPRDALASLLQRFGDYGVKFVPACSDLNRNIASLITARQTLDNLSFFYEDRFTETPDSVRRIAEFLEIPLDDQQVIDIFDKFTAASVKSLISDLQQQPSDRWYVDHTGNQMDRETSFHATHISDMRIGKWKDVLNQSEQKTAAGFLGEYSTCFVNRAGADPSDPSTEMIGDGFKLEFPTSIFGPVDSIGKFTRFLTKDEATSDLGTKIFEYVYLPSDFWLCELAVANRHGIMATYCQNGQVVFRDEQFTEVSRFQFANTMHDHPIDIHVKYADDEEGRSSSMEAELTIRRKMVGRAATGGVEG